jgi:cyclohexanecarboxylate-CoA ligase
MNNIEGVKLGQSFEDYRRSLWPQRLLFSYLDENAAAEPDRIAIAEHRSGYLEHRKTTYRELQIYSQRVALALRARGIGRGDVVSFQLPNWREAVALHLGCLRIGAISNPLVPIFRDRELRFMLAFAETKLLVMPETFQGFHYREMWLRLKPEMPMISDAFFVGEGSESNFEKFFMERPWEAEGGLERLGQYTADADDVAQLMYTSGTTGEPKGVIHSSNTLLFSALSVITHLGLDRETVLMSSTVGHQIGFVWGIILPILVRGSVVFQDVWNAENGVQLIKSERVTFSLGSTPFLVDLSNAARNNGLTFPDFRTFVCAGAPIPRALVERGLKDLGARIFSCWGMTENGAVTMTGPEDPIEKVTGTDGRALSGAAVRTVDASRRLLPAGVEGELQARTPSMALGYLKRPDLFPCGQDGWMDTGDLAIMDEAGYIRISGRSKDIIIRGGENIPVVEIENILYEHPALQDVAIVAMPDDRLGERACAFVTLGEEGVSITLQQLINFLMEYKVARQYLPERLEILDHMPRTMSGKIQKAKLRELAKQFVERRQEN